MKNKKLWGGRFEKGLHRIVEQFTESLHFDKRLYAYDIEGSIAHAKMLAHCCLISKEDAQIIIDGLISIRKELDEGIFPFDTSMEDIHMNIEKRLTDIVGPVGGKLHTARSRNDQVSLDVRLYLRAHILEIMSLLNKFQKALISKAKKHVATIVPGYTHLQRAQPVSFAHYLLAYFEMIKRDMQRLAQCQKRVSVMPLGSAALSGTGLAIDRKFVANELGFAEISENSLDAVSDRDFIIEFLSVASIIMMHFSRFAEEIVLWASSEFGFIDLPDTICTGSSLMPQKKNPDPMELIRGKTGRVYGNLITLLTVMKALPLSYNRDLQEDKEPLFDTVDTLKGVLLVACLVIETLQVRENRMRQAAEEGFLNATDLAEYLVKKGLPFRQAHEKAGQIVLEGIKRDITTLMKIELDTYKKICPLIEEDIFDYLTLESSLSVKNIPGGTAPCAVSEALKRAEDYTKGLENGLF
ncbi:MAG: argininosuccinate lyase [bacterium]